MMNAQKKLARQRSDEKENEAATHIQALVRGARARSSDEKCHNAVENVAMLRKNVLLKAEIQAAKHAQVKHKAAQKLKSAQKRETHDAMKEALQLMEAMKDHDDQEATLDSYGGIIAAYGNTTR